MKIVKDKKFLQGTKGVSLIELLVVFAILGIVAVTIYSTFAASLKSADQIQAMTILQEEARTLAEILSRDIRLAGSFPNGTNCTLPSIVNATSTLLRITRDLNGNKECIDEDEDVSYEYQNNTLIRKNSNGSFLLIGDYIRLDCFSFFYFDANGNQTANPDDILTVCVKAVLRSPWKISGYNNTNVYDICGPFNDAYPRKYVDFCTTIRNRVIGR